MAAPKFNKNQRLQVLARVSDLWTTAHTPSQIAQELGVSTRQVHHYIRQLKNEWIEHNQQAVADHRARLVAESFAVKRQAWKGWWRSLTDAEKKQIGVRGETEIDITETVGQAGDPRFLQVIQKSLEFESDMVQATPPKKIAPTTPEGDALPIKIYTGIDLDKV